MKKIKFRAWDTGRKEMLPEIEFWGAGVDMEIGDVWAGSPVDSRDLILMQYIGLTLDGEEVYENDLLQGKDNYGKDSHIYRVVYYFTAYHVEWIEDGKPFTAPITPQLLNSFNLGVIGNVHEDRNLFKGLFKEDI